MGHALVQWAWHHDSGLPEDDTVNTWHFDTGGATVASKASAIVANLRDFWITTRSSPGDGNKLSDFLSVLLSGAYTAKVYDMADPSPRTPVFTSDNTVTISASSALPEELAVCLSFHGEIASGDIPARHKGRVYLGPLVPGAFNATSGDKGRVNSDFNQDIRLAAEQLMDDSTTDAADWCVFSREDDALYPVVGGWVDNAADVQRRRGRKATSRSFWPA